MAGSAPGGSRADVAMVAARKFYEVQLYDRAWEEAKRLVPAVGPQAVEELSTIVVVLKGTLDQLRRALRVVNVIEQREDAKGNALRVDGLRDYRSRIESEFGSRLDEAASVVEGCLAKSLTDAMKVLVLKTKADVLRYEVEIHKAEPEAVLAAYEDARRLATDEVAGAASPLRLGIALNLASFHAEALENRPKALEIVRRARAEGEAAVRGLPTAEAGDSREYLRALQEAEEEWR